MNTVFIATYGTTTYAEVKAAYDAGKACFAYIEVYDAMAHLSEVNGSGNFVFSYIDYGSQNLVFIELYSDDDWGYGNLGSVLTDMTISNYPVTLGSDPTSAMHAATKQYVDNNKGIFVATFDVTTYEEIKAAYDAGKVCFAVKGSVLYPLSAMSGILCMFSNARIGVIKQISISKTNVWTENDDVYILNKSGDTMTGALVAASGDIGTKQARNIYAGTSDMTAGTSTLATGDIYIVYE